MVRISGYIYDATWPFCCVIHHTRIAANPKGLLTVVDNADHPFLVSSRRGITTYQLLKTSTRT